RVGDDIYVSGTLGDARLALEVFRGTLSLPAEVFARARARLEQPVPRIALGMALRGIATAAVDISDGLVGDLGHILSASSRGEHALGAAIQADAAIRLLGLEAPASRGREPGLSPDDRLRYVLAGGDDYELAFTAPPSARQAVQAAASHSRTRITRVGEVVNDGGVRLIDPDGRSRDPGLSSFDHFA
ncbi:MAG: thiamine-phosphate kinase, partial [Haliea sp.]